ncbi:MAG: dUTP diphosphatase [Oscillospiraceae bacterium]|nr:dUTP diphosphatase [Oscillospiraceae bacterium]
MHIQIQKLRESARLPHRGSAFAAGYDLYAAPADGQPIEIAPHTTAMVGTGLAVAIPEGYFGGVFARSGLASKQGLRPANCVGVIDADYRGECTVALHNDTDAPRTIQPGDRIAQLVILPFLAAEFEETQALPETERGTGGFGSTGN